MSTTETKVTTGRPDHQDEVEQALELLQRHGTPEVLTVGTRPQTIGDIIGLHETSVKHWCKQSQRIEKTWGYDVESEQSVRTYRIKAGPRLYGGEPSWKAARSRQISDAVKEEINERI